MSIETYDFRKPGQLPTQVSQHLEKWLKAACAVASVRIKDHIPTPFQFSYRGETTSRITECITTLDPNAVGYVVLFEQKIKTLLIFTRPLILGINSAMLGEELEELPEDREITPVEESLLEMFICELISSLVEGWPENSEIQVKMGDREPSLERTKIFKPDEKLVLCRLDIAGTFGSHEILWMIPEEPVIQMNTTDVKPPEVGPDTTKSLEILASQIPVQLSVTLGHAELRLSDLANLSEGDLIVLDQKVNDPLTAEADGGLRFMVWPGRVGGRRACQIADTDA